MTWQHQTKIFRSRAQKIVRFQNQIRRPSSAFFEGELILLRTKELATILSNIRFWLLTFYKNCESKSPTVLVGCGINCVMIM